MRPEVKPVFEFLEALAGPVVYLGYLSAVYFANTLFCLLASGPELPRLAIVVATVAALILLALIGLDGLRRLSAAGNRAGENNEAFLASLMILLGALSALAVIWTGVPTVFVAPCS